MSWMVFTLVSAGLVKNIEPNHFKNHKECSAFIEQLHSDQRKSCFHENAKFKSPKAAPKTNPKNIPAKLQK